MNRYHAYSYNKSQVPVFMMTIVHILRLLSEVHESKNKSSLLRRVALRSSSPHINLCRRLNIL